jgi:hypothetical protein
MGPRGPSTVTELAAYDRPADFRRALTHRLRRLAESSRWDLPQLQRQIAYDRLLERLYLTNDDWIVKGATALLARDIGVRATIDVDLYRRAGTASAEADLRAAARLDLGDWFRFDVGAARLASGAAGGVRLPVQSSVGPTVWASFHVDLVGTGIRMTGEPEPVPPMARVLIPGVEQHGYRAYPLVDHVADKIVAMFELHGRAGAPSTRYKDLIDLVAIIFAAPVDAEAQLRALHSEVSRRELRLPSQFDVPDRRLWEPGYRAESRRSLLPVARTLNEALLMVRPFTDPLFDGTAEGRWSPADLRWQPGPGRPAASPQRTDG